MKKTEPRYLLDSSAWLAYFQGEDTKLGELIEGVDNLLFTSVITLHEIKRKLKKRKTPLQRVEEVLSFIKDRSIMVDITPQISEKSADDSISNRLHTIDSLIYRSALENNAALVTMDHDFKGLKGVLLISP